VSSGEEADDARFELAIADAGPDDVYMNCSVRSLDAFMFCGEGMVIELTEDQPVPPAVSQMRRTDLGPDLEHVFEADAHLGELALEQHDHV
jgi:hypothetical protein